MTMSIPDDAAGDILFRPIGIIHSPHTDPDQTPVQPRFAGGCSGQAVLLPQFTPGLAGLEAFSHIYLLWHLHRAADVRLRVTPYLSDEKRGVFATRSPLRPNKIGLSIVRLERIEGNIIYLLDVDMLDGSPLLDIKPFVAAFDNIGPDNRSGWLEGINWTSPDIQKRGQKKRGGAE